MEWLISRVCEEFHCLPMAALDAIEDDAEGLIPVVLELRAYERATSAWERATGQGGDEQLAAQLAGDDMVQEVITHEFEDAQEAMRARSAE